MFPDRSEPYVHLGTYLNQKGQHELAYTYLKTATLNSLAEVKKKYILFVNMTCYGKYINDELAVACYWTNRLEEGIGYLNQIINDPEFKSEHERFASNLQHFNNKMNGN